jgi:dTMP kinase
MRDVWNKFFVIEGLDGAGTTTQLHAVSALYQAEGRPIFATCEPTDGLIGSLVRRALRKEICLSPCQMALLYAADRDEHVREMSVRLKQGATVISDRYLFSSLAYQSVELPYAFVASLNDGFPLPSVVFFIDTPVEECLRRIEIRGRKKELFEIQSFLEKVKRNYELSFEGLPADSTLVRVDGMLPIDAISEQITRFLRTRNCFSE